MVNEHICLQHVILYQNLKNKFLHVILYQNDDLGFTLVDFTKIVWKEYPFIMAYQEKQVLYVRDPSNERWLVVVQGRIEHDVHP